MAIATVLSYSPSESRIVIDEVIGAAALTSIINITKGTQLYTIGKDSLVSFNVIDNNSVITLSTDTSSDDGDDIISVRYQGPPPWENVNYLRKDDPLLDNLANISALPNNTRINGVEHFYQAEKPLTRADGSALVVGDRWWNTSEAQSAQNLYGQSLPDWFYAGVNLPYDVSYSPEWFWNGTYWLSRNVETLYSKVSGNFANNQVKPWPNFILPFKNIFLKAVIYTGQTATPAGYSGNYMSVAFGIYTVGESYDYGGWTNYVPISSSSIIFNMPVVADLYIPKPTHSFDNWPYRNYPYVYKVLGIRYTSSVNAPMTYELGLTIHFHEVA